MGSARIEGNNTTLSEYVEKIIEKNLEEDESQDEIENLDKAIEFIEENTDETTKFDRAFISEVHKILTKDLAPPPKGEGSMYPGELRRHNVNIQSSGHTPPEYMVLRDYFNDFIEFINFPHKEQYQLLMVAIAHHRFEYMHPYDNGNGRMGRLLNYAFLIKLGFKVKNGRIINPSSVFHTDRDKYLGLKNEIEKIDSLLNKDYVVEILLIPTIRYARYNEHITAQEYKILEYLIKTDNMAMKAEELSALGINDSKAKSRTMAKLRDKGIISPSIEKGRIYTIRFINNYLLRGIMEELDENGFVSDFLNHN